MISSQVRRSFLCLFRKQSASFLSHVSFSTDVAAPTGNSESVASFLKEKGFSDTQLEKVFETRRSLRFADLEKSIKPKIYLFKEFGFSESQIVQIITRDPTILCYSLTKRIRPSLSTLQDLLGSRHNKAFKVLLRTWSFFRQNLKKSLCPNIEFLKSYGVPMERILHLLCSLPPSLFIKPELLRKHVEKLERLGMDSRSKMFIYGIWVVSSMTDHVWELKLQTFRDLGFTDSEIIDIFRKTPQVFVISAEKIKKIAEVVLATGRYETASMMGHPVCFSYSLEKRVMPRIKVLEVLEKGKVIQKWPSLTTICVYSDERFREAFVAPYPPELFRGITLPSRGGEKNDGTLLDAK